MVSSPKSVIDQLAESVRSGLASALPQGGRAVVGYSGGIDSSTLLALAARYAPESVAVSALHVNHGLHPDATSWERQCVRQCATWQVPVQVVKLALDPEASGLEDKARVGRLAALRAYDADVVLLGHHADDQAETVVQRLFRGSGMRGLAAMRTITQVPKSKQVLLRPLLPFPKAMVTMIAPNLGIKGIVDPANADLRHNRNWIRHNVLPEASRRYPGAPDAVVLTAELAADAAKLLDDLAAQDDQSCRLDGRLDRQRIAQLGPARVRNWLAWSLYVVGHYPPHRRHLHEAARQLCMTKGAVLFRFDRACLSGDAKWLAWDGLAECEVAKITQSDAL